MRSGLHNLLLAVQPCVLRTADMLQLKFASLQNAVWGL